MSTPAEKFKNSTEIAVTNPRDVRPVYANGIGITHTLTDVTLFFTQIGTLPGADGSPTPHQEVQVGVTMNPALIPGLIESLQQVIKQLGQMVAQQSAANARTPQTTEAKA